MKSRHFYPQMQSCPTPGASVQYSAIMEEWADMHSWISFEKTMVRLFVSAEISVAVYARTGESEQYW